MTSYRTIRASGFSLVIAPKRLALLLALTLLIFLVALWSISSGTKHIPFGEIFTALFTSDAQPSTDANVVVDFRLSRLTLALVSGAMLGVAGAIMQSLTRNGLADPSLLGVREGAALSVLVCLFLVPSLPTALRPVAGVIGGLTSAVIVFALSGVTSRLRFVLTGIGFSWFLSALLLILMASLDIRSLQSAMIWMAGNLQGASWDAVSILAIILAAALVLVCVTARAADTQALGDSAAAALGINLRFLSSLHFSLAVTLTASCVSYTGSIGFVGLIGPHIARFLMPGGSFLGITVGAGLTGALLVTTADTIARTAFSPLELPTGLVLSAVGAPTLLLLLWLHRHRL